MKGKLKMILEKDPHRVNANLDSVKKDKKIKTEQLLEGAFIIHATTKRWWKKKQTGKTIKIFTPKFY